MNFSSPAVEDCTVGQCKNGGECTYFGAGKYLCACPIRWSGQNCEISMDIVAIFVLHSSLIRFTMHVQKTK